MGVDAERRRDLRGYAAIIIALGGLVTAFGAVLRKPPEDAARAGYLELTKAILDSQAAEKQNHDDLLALRSFVETYARGHEAIVIPVVEAGAPVPADAAPQIVHASAPADAASPPHVTPLKPPTPPRDFSAL